MTDALIDIAAQKIVEQGFNPATARAIAGIAASVFMGDTSARNQWTCFHCGETFTTTGAASDHFGDNSFKTPGCVAKIKIGHERSWLMHVRKLEKARDDLAVLRSSEYAEPAGKWPNYMLVSRHSDYEKMEKIVEDLVKDLPFCDTQVSEISKQLRAMADSYRKEWQAKGGIGSIGNEIEGGK